MSCSGRLERGSRDLYCRGRPGAGCTSSETVGRRGRCSGAALCAECRGLVGGIGGSLVRSQRGQFQSGSKQNGARRGRLGRLGCKTEVARRRALNAVHGHVWHEASARVCVREHGWRSRHPQACGTCAERGLGQVLRPVWSAGYGWAVWTVVCGARWRKDRPWLPLYAAAQRACPGYVSEREGGQW
jgi:hypothetical protein